MSFRKIRAWSFVPPFVIGVPLGVAAGLCGWPLPVTCLVAGVLIVGDLAVELYDEWREGR